MHAAARNPAVADAAFRQAIDLAADSAAARYYYAQFLRTQRNDVDASIELIERALELAPDEPRLLLESVRCNVETLSFEKGREDLMDLLFSGRRVTPAVARETWHLNVEYWVVRACFETLTREHERALSCLEQLRKDIESAPAVAFPSLLVPLQRAFGPAWWIRDSVLTEGASARLEALLAWLKGQRGLRVPNAVALSDDIAFGTVKFTEPDQEYGFLQSIDHGDVFFNRRNCTDRNDFDLLKPGLTIYYRPAASERGRRAIDVSVS